MDVSNQRSGCVVKIPTPHKNMSIPKLEKSLDTGNVNRIMNMPLSPPKGDDGYYLIILDDYDVVFLHSH